MEVPIGLKCAAMAVELVGTALGFITKINQALETAGENKLEYEYLRGRLPAIREVLRHLPPDSEFDKPLDELISILQQAYDLVIDCEERSSANQLIRASNHADKLRSVNAKIDSHLILFNLISSNAILRRIEERGCCSSSAGSAQKVKDVVVAERKIPEICPPSRTSLPDRSSTGSPFKLLDRIPHVFALADILAAMKNSSQDMW